MQFYRKDFGIIIIIIVLMVLDFRLFLKIKQRNNNVKGIQYVNNLKDKIIFTPQSNLKYFFELSKNSVRIDNPEWLKEKATYHFNSDGLNELVDYELNKKNDTYRIVAIGDSFTFGAYVNTGEGWPDKLEGLLNDNLNCSNIKKYEVLNLGVSGYDVEYPIERLFRTGLKYSPDLVIWLINDVNFRKINEYISPIKKNFEQEGKVRFDLKRGYLSSILAQQKIIELYGLDQILQYQITRLERLKKDYKGNLLFVSFSSIKSDFENVLIQFNKGNSNSTFMKIPDLDPNTEKLPDSHPNEAGYKKISDNIYKILTDKLKENCANNI